VRMQMAQKLVNDQSDMILTLGTGASQSVAAETTEIPIIITAVTDPVDAGLAESIQCPGGNVTGMSDLTPVASQFELMLRLVPSIQTVGIIYSSSESNSRIQAEIAKAKALELGLTYVEGTVIGTADVAQVAQSIVGRVDAFYVPTCNTVAAAYQIVIQIADEFNIPVFAGEEAGVNQGALATEGVNYYNLGRQTAIMAVKVLRGEASPAEMPIQYLDSNNIVINMQTAERLGITIPDDIKAVAKLVD